MKKCVVIVGIFIFGMIFSVTGVQPNYEETTIHHVNGDPVLDITSVTTVYTNGLGQPIETKTKHPVGNDITTCTFYDKAGRPEYVTKTFIDNSRRGEYLPGDITDPNLLTQLYSTYNNPVDTSLYTQNIFWDTPLGQVKKSIQPGDINDPVYGRSWTFGVDSTESIPTKVVYGGSITFQHGFASEFTVAAWSNMEELLDVVNDTFVVNNPFSEPKHFLTISLDAEGKISEVLKDISGNILKTFADPTVGSTAGMAIISRNEYDLLGNLLRETPPVVTSNQLNSTEYRYNTLRQLIWKKTPDGGMFRYTYRDNGQLDNVLSYTMNGSDTVRIRRVGYEYDGLGRLIYIYARYPQTDIFGTSEVPYEQVHYFYDNIDDVKTREVFQCIPERYFSDCTNLKGRLAATETVHHMKRGRSLTDRKKIGEVYSYDEDGRLKAKYLTMTGSTLFQVIFYFYDIHGKILVEDFYYGVDHFAKQYLYDALGRLWKVQQLKPKSDGTYDTLTLSETAYDALGRIQNKKLSAISGDYHTTYAYDILERITKMTTMNQQNGFVAFSEEICGYDGMSNKFSGYKKNGNISNNEFIYGSPVSKNYRYAYRYDELERLVGSLEENGDTPVRDTFTYDTIGRFASKTEGDQTVSGYQYYSGTNRLKKTSKNTTAGTEYVYDALGNMVVDYTKNLVIEYDYRDLPIFFRFYQNLTSAGLTMDATTGTYIGENIYETMRQKVDDNTVTLVSTVMMLYNADGDRVCKMEVQE